MSENTESSEVVESSNEESISNEEVSPEISDESVEVSDEEVSEELEVSDESEEALYSINVDGEDIQVPLEELLKGYQTGSASQKRFKAAAELQKQAKLDSEASSKLFEGDFMGNAIKEAVKRGIANPEDIQNWVFEKAQQFLDVEAMDPQERELLEANKKIEAYEAVEREKADTAQKQQFQNQVESRREDYSNQINEAIEAVGLDSDPLTIQKIAQIVHNSITDDKQEALSIKEAATYLKDSSKSSLQGYLENLSIEDKMKLFGDKGLKELRKQDLKKVKNPSRKAKKKEVVDDEKPASKSMSDFFSNLKRD